MTIKYYGYKYAPESVKVYVNNELLKTDNTMINNYIVCGRTSDAEKEIKKLYRAKMKKDNNYCFGFSAAGSKTFYYITALSFRASDDIKRRLYCYKELKHYLQKNTPQIIVENGYITPDGVTTPTTKKINIDFDKLLKIKLV